MPRRMPTTARQRPSRIDHSRAPPRSAASCCARAASPPAQQRAFDEHWPRFGLDYTGSDRATSTRSSAAARRACSRSASATASSCVFAAQHEPAARLHRHRSACARRRPPAERAGRRRHATTSASTSHDAVEVLQHEIADGALDEVRIYFPDPWHKKRHNKRRLVQPEFVGAAGAQARARRPLAPRHRLAGLCRADVGRARRRAAACATAPARAAHVPRPGLAAGRPISRRAARNSATASGICCTTAADA